MLEEHTPVISVHTCSFVIISWPLHTDSFCCAHYVHTPSLLIIQPPFSTLLRSKVGRGLSLVLAACFIMHGTAGLTRGASEGKPGFNERGRQPDTCNKLRLSWWATGSIACSHALPEHPALPHIEHHTEAFYFSTTLCLKSFYCKLHMLC